MSGSLNQMPRYQAKLPRTGHYIGRDFYFTSSVGMILPIYRARLNQGETVNCKFAMNIQARPLRRPTAMKIRQKIDVFFVPEQLIYTAFGQHYYQTNDFLSSGFDPSGGPNDALLPLLNFQSFFGDTEYGGYNNLMLPTIDSDSDNVLPSTDDNNYRFDCFGKSAYRLLMHLGYNPSVIFRYFDTDNSYTAANMGYYIGEFSTKQPSVFADFLYAYNAIYQNYYRNDDRELRDLYCYQIDWMNSGFDGSGVLYEHRNMFYTRYHSRIMDYFTSLKVSPIASVLNMAAPSRVGDTRNIDVLLEVNNYLTSREVAASDNTETPLDSSDVFELNKIYTGTQTNIGNVLSTGAIRSMFAVEKLMRIYGRARKNYDSQTLAHLGFKVPRDVKHEITFIGSIDGGIGVKQITSLAGTETTELGELAGNASGYCGGSVPKFTAPCHGVLMAVTYAIPEVSYSLGDTHDKLNDLTSRLDLYIPEFDSLGMQPVSMQEAFCKRDLDASSIVIGWQYRYEQYKRQYDVHSIAFHRPFDIDDLYSSSGDNVLPENSWSPWIVGAHPFDAFEVTLDSDGDPTDANLTYDAFLVSPTFLNGIMVQDYDPLLHLPATAAAFLPDADENLPVNYARTPWLMFQTDPFMNACRCDVTLVSTMSTYGEPELI